MADECSNHHSQYMYHASAQGIAGEFYRPSRHSLPMQGAIVLPPHGGRHSHKVGKFKLDGLISYEEIMVEVGGSYDDCHDIQTSYAYAVIEGLNIADMVTADRVVSRMMIYSPPGDYGGEHTFDITGSHFENLKIAGHRIDLNLATDVFHQVNSFSKFTEFYNSKKADEWLIPGKLGQLPDEELKTLEDKYHAMRGMAPLVKAWKSDAKREPKDRYWCSAANHLDLQKHAGVRENSEVQSHGGVIVIPKFGVVRLAEVVVDKHRRMLNMLRVDMCSTGHGSTTGGGSGGGSTFP